MTEMRARVGKQLAHTADHPWLNLAVGLVLLVSASAEVFEGVEEEFQAGSHHGVWLFGLVHAFKSLSHIVKGTK